MVIKGDLYVSGKIYEGDNPGDDGFDSLDEIASGSNESIFNSNADESNLKIASNDTDITDNDSGNVDSLSDNNDSSNNIDDGNESDSSDDGFEINDDMFSSKSSTSNKADFNTSSEYAELEQFLALSNEVKELSNRIDMVSLELKETQQYMREGFAMSSALAAMPTPTNYGLNFSAGAGNYDGSNALAFGFVYVKENYVINVGHAKSDTGGKTMTNIGFTYNISSWFKK
jgi:hypothetical protein